MHWSRVLISLEFWFRKLDLTLNFCCLLEKKKKKKFISTHLLLTRIICDHGKSKPYSYILIFVTMGNQNPIVISLLYQEMIEKIVIKNRQNSKFNELNIFSLLFLLIFLEDGFKSPSEKLHYSPFPSSLFSTTSNKGKFSFSILPFLHPTKQAMQWNFQSSFCFVLFCFFFFFFGDCYHVVCPKWSIISTALQIFH